MLLHLVPHKLQKMLNIAPHPPYHHTTIWQALYLKHTDAFRLQPEASARHHWASRPSVAEMALLTWFLLRLPTYKSILLSSASCLLLLHPSSLQCHLTHLSRESADRLSSRVSVCISQWSSCREGCKMQNYTFISIKSVFLHSRNETCVNNTDFVTMCDM